MAGMRLLVLSPLFASLTSLSGAWPKLEKLYARLFAREAPRVVDLLFRLPSRAVDRRARIAISRSPAPASLSVEAACRSARTRRHCP
jgi:ATP-dependent DNA helicase RecG